ncbi:MAG TPA: BMP family ABC transporter substrate-binding protein [Lachnospiraceae bacterium]|nr:BMP family ABC transporter substrate-binding protein [Lachnospiraceae bacterium]
MKKKALSLVLASAMVASLVGCGSSAETETPSAAETTTTEAAATEAATTEAAATEAATTDNSDKKIAMITDSGDITDESFNQITWETCVAYGEANGIETQYYKPAEDTDEERINAVDLAVAEGATVVVMPGYLFGPAIAEEQDLYPDVTFIAVDVTEGDIVNLAGENVALGSNVYICSFQEEQAGYLAGYAAVKDGYTSLGFLGGIAVPAVIRYGFGYIQGINAAAEEMGVDVDVKYYYGGQFYGDDAITARMEGWYADGTQVVFACGGGIYTSAVDAAAQYDGKVIGVDVDQFPKIGDACITSAMKGLGSAVEAALDAYTSGNWSSIGGKSEQLGLTQGDYLGLPTADASWGFKTFTKDEYETVLNGIKDGSITVSNDTENQPEVGSHVTVTYVE